MENIERIQLLSSTEVEELYSRPEFNAHEQCLYFSLSPAERAALEQFRNTRTRIHFILQLGYFKAKQQFFNFSFDEVSSDVQYIVATYYSDADATQFTGSLSREYSRKQRQAILSLFAYRSWSPQYTAEIESHISLLLRYYPKGHSAFRQLLAFFDHQKLIIPSYRTFQDMFSRTFAAEEQRLSNAISSIPAPISDQLMTLVRRDDGITALNIIRADQKDFQYTAVKAEVDKALRIEELYEFAKGFIPSLGLAKMHIPPHHEHRFWRMVNSHSD